MSTESQAMKCLYRDYLSPFIGLTHRLSYPGQPYHHNWHIELLARTLQLCYVRQIKRLVINMPPRYLKSMSVSVALPAWIHGHDPTANIMCVAGHRSLVEEHHARTHNLMNQAKYRAIFPHVDVVETGNELRLAHGGTRKGFTPLDGMTGHGADFIIIDDPLPANLTENDDARARINRWYDETVYQRLDDKTNGVIIVVMQRLHDDDLCGHLSGREGWGLLNLKAIAEKDEIYPGLFGDRVIRAKGEALHPELEDRDQLIKAMLNMGAKTFMAQYQQEPYLPGKGEGCHGGSTDELRSLGIMIPKDSEAFVPRSEERYVLRDVFDQVDAVEKLDYT